MKADKKQKKLSSRFIVGLLLLFLVLGVIISAVTSYNLYDQMMDKYNRIAFGSAHMAADLIDGDRIAGYLETKERDEYYMDVRARLDTIARDFDLMYCYVYVPHEDHLTYVWASNDENKLLIGVDDVYSEGGKEISFLAFEKDPEYKMVSDTDEEYGDFMVACVPIYDSAGEPVALAAADISTKMIKSSIMEAIGDVLNVMLILMMIAVVVYYFYINRNVIKPVLNLTRSVEGMVSDVAKGEDIEIDVHTNDEIEALARSFEKMNRDLREYISENTRINAEKERIEAELDTARHIQASQLPGKFPAFPDRTEFDIFASMTPAKEVGGDFYDFFFVDDDHLAIVIADVSGKGVPAALFMMMSKMVISNYAKAGLSPHEVLERANNTICRNNKEKMFVTVWLGILEVSTGKVTAADGGHEYPFIRQPDGNFEIFKRKHDFIVGFKKNKKYNDYEFTLQKGASLFVYTDGIPEATNSSGKMFGLDRLSMALNSSPEASPQQLLENVRCSVNGFVGEAPQFDDLTMLCITLL